MNIVLNIFGLCHLKSLTLRACALKLLDVEITAAEANTNQYQTDYTLADVVKFLSCCCTVCLYILKQYVTVLVLRQLLSMIFYITMQPSVT